MSVCSVTCIIIQIRMMELSFFDKMERKFGKYAINNLPMILTACFGIGYLLYMFVPSITSKLYFSPADIIVGHEYWRLFTWILTPAGGINIFTILMMFVYFSVGMAIERAMGTFMFNVFIFGGWLVNTICCMAVSVYEYLRIGDDAIFYLYSTVNNGIEMTDLMQISLFLGFTLIYSEAYMMLYFFIPLKAKWIGYLDMLLLAYRFASTSNLITKVSIIAYMLNFVIIYLGTQNRSRRKGRYTSDIKRKRARSRFTEIDGGRVNDIENEKDINPDTKQTKPKNVITRHKCAVCGRTELDDPELEFRFCSKCNGNYEYCSEHLYTHEHVR